MLGSHCGCFAVGGLIGFLLAVAGAGAAYYYYKSPSFSEKMQKVENVWGEVKKGGEMLSQFTKGEALPVSTTAQVEIVQKEPEAAPKTENSGNFQVNKLKKGNRRRK